MPSKICQTGVGTRVLIIVSTLLFLRPLLARTPLSLYFRNSERGRNHGMGQSKRFLNLYMKEFVRQKKHENNASYHFRSQEV